MYGAFFFLRTVSISDHCNFAYSFFENRNFLATHYLKKKRIFRYLKYLYFRQEISFKRGPECNVSDPDYFIPDPDPAFRLNTNPDPGFL